MKKIIFISQLFLFSLFVSAQESLSICDTKIDFNIEKCSDQISNGEKFAIINWNFAEIKSNNLELFLEIIPIKDCFNTTQAQRFKELISFKIDNNNLKNTDKIKVFHKEMISKCFKYRFRTNSSNCNDATPWFFHSFIDKK